MHDVGKAVQIPRELFMDLVRCHLMEIRDPAMEERIREGLQSKLEKAAARESFSKSRAHHPVD